MLHLYVDVGLYPGIENVNVNVRWNVDGYELRNGYGETKIPKEVLQSTGNVSVIRKYDAKEFQEGDFVWIVHSRMLDKTSVDKSLEKRNTGFQLTWFYEDSTGKRVDIETHNSFGNLNYVGFLNLVFDAITKGRVKKWNFLSNPPLNLIHGKI